MQNPVITTTALHCPRTPPRTLYIHQEETSCHAHEGCQCVAHLHMADIVQDTLHCMYWKVLRVSPYSPDPPLCHFHMFSPLKSVLMGNTFRFEEDVKGVWCSDSNSSLGTPYGGVPSVDASMRCMHQHLWGQILMVSTPFPRVIPKQESFR